MDADPRSLVEAPVRRALTGVIARGLALVAAVAALAVWPVIASPEVVVRDGIAVVVVAVLIVYVLLVHASRVGRARPPEEAVELAWDRAKEIDRDEAALGLMVAGWVPVGLLLALGVLLWPHLTDSNPALAAAWSVLGLPPIAIAWMVATSTWLAACREDLARAEHEADVRFRTYWANVGR
jgi:hypothetical protein